MTALPSIHEIFPGYLRPLPPRAPSPELYPTVFILHTNSESQLTHQYTTDDSIADQMRKHICKICHKRFNRPSSLRIHQNTHTGDTPFRCPYPECGRSFNVNSNMQRHYRNHSATGGPASVYPKEGGVVESSSSSPSPPRPPSPPSQKSTSPPAPTAPSSHPAAPTISPLSSHRPKVNRGAYVWCPSSSDSEEEDNAGGAREQPSFKLHAASFTDVPRVCNEWRDGLGGYGDVDRGTKRRRVEEGRRWPCWDRVSDIRTK